MRLVLIGFGYLLPLMAHGHGGVVLENDLCLIKVGFYEAHFTIFQPLTRGHEQYCEDIPDLGESVFVLEYLHDGLEQMAVDLRIIRNTTGLGQFAGVDDVEAIGDLDEITVFYHPPATDPDSFATLHTFTEQGEFIGIANAISVEGEVYTAIFPFEVNVGGFGDTAVLGILIVGVVLMFAVFGNNLIGGRRTKEPDQIQEKTVGWKGASMSVLVFVAGLFVVGSHDVRAEADGRLQNSGDYFVISVQPQLDPIEINQMHSWHLQLHRLDGTAVNDAQISLTGGMPLHDHGLPSAPQARPVEVDGHYVVEGIKFHMGGRWQMVFTIETAAATEAVTVDIDL